MRRSIDSRSTPERTISAVVRTAFHLYQIVVAKTKPAEDMSARFTYDESVSWLEWEYCARSYTLLLHSHCSLSADACCLRPRVPLTLLSQSLFRNLDTSSKLCSALRHLHLPHACAPAAFCNVLPSSSPRSGYQHACVREVPRCTPHLDEKEAGMRYLKVVRRLAGSQLLARSRHSDITTVQQCRRNKRRH